MKRILLIAALLCGTLSLFAQNKGDKYFAFSLGAGFGDQKQELSNGALSTTASQPLTTSLSLQGEIGYFIADLFRVGLALGVPFTSTPSTEADNGDWLMTKTVGLQINPSIAYYVPLADNLYYTPEVGGAYEIGSYKEELTTTNTYNADYTGWDLYLHFLALEYRVNEKLALGVGVGALSYVKATVTDKDTDASLSTSQFQFLLNSGSVNVRFYF